MHRPTMGLAALALCSAATLVAASTGTAADAGSSVSGRPTAAPVAGAASPTGDGTGVSKEDHRPSREASKRAELREQALASVLNGRATPVKRGPSTVVKLGGTKKRAAVDARGRLTRTTEEAQYVELSRETTDRVFVVLAEFGNERHPDFPDKDTDPKVPGPTTFEGPAHNQIAEPDRFKNNITRWLPDFSREHFEELYFGQGGQPGSNGAPESVRQYFERQSSGRYSIEGEVTDWTKVRYNEARYGRTDGARFLIQDAVNQWVADQKAAGRTTQQIREELDTFDVWDRYDFDHDGDFNEPDGYIDHLQVIHAGMDESNGGGAQGEDAIWAHRGAADVTPVGKGGPEGNPGGGAAMGDTGVWVRDYTVNPENGGTSIIAHEYSHDLDLPDLYNYGDKPGNSNVQYWSIMAQHWIHSAKDQGIGVRAADLGAWEKLQLGWLDHETVLPAQGKTLTLGPGEYNTARAQAAVVVLPKKNVTKTLVPPATGKKSWWGGTGNNLDNTLTRQVTLPAGKATLSMKANYDIEDCKADPCDYTYVEVDDGSGFVAIPGSITNPAEGNGIEGKSDGWKPATFDLSAYAGKSVSLRIRSHTDGGFETLGFFADDIAVTAGGKTVFESGAENGAEGWTTGGFAAVGETETTAYDNYYVMSHRDYVSFDKYLRTGPYTSGFRGTDRPSIADPFPYQDGLLISYWDTSQSNNNVPDHPGQGLILAVDAHPAPLVQIDGAFWPSNVSMYDATFSTERAESLKLHVNGKPSYIRGRAAQSLFNDSRRYWSAKVPNDGVKVPNNGVNIKVLSQSGTTMKVKVWKRK